LYDTMGKALAQAPTTNTTPPGHAKGPSPLAILTSMASV
jgi:hypothetical protein